MPAPNNSVTGGFSCEEATAIVTGWFRPPSGCYEIAVASFDRSTELNRAELILTNRADNPTEDTTCEEVKINYQVTLEFDAGGPTAISVKYQSPVSDTAETFTLQNESC